METNNYVESWHNQLKTTYFKRKRPQRLDSIIYTLVHEVEFDIQRQVERRAAQNGRLTNQQRYYRIQKLLAYDIAKAQMQGLGYLHPPHVHPLTKFFRSR